MMDEIKMGEHQARNANTELLQQAEYCENECIVMKKFVTSSKQIQQLQADKGELIESCYKIKNLACSSLLRLKNRYSEHPRFHRGSQIITEAVKIIQKHKDSTQEG